MSFDFFNDSQSIFDDFTGIAGSENKVKIHLAVKTYEEFNPRPVITETIMEEYGLITDLKPESTTFQIYIQNGRRGISLRLMSKSDILHRINQTSFEAMELQHCWFEWNGERFNITGWRDYANNNMVRFFASYAGKVD